MAAVLPEDLDPPDPQVRRLRWATHVVLAVGLGACLANGANTRADPSVDRARLAGFGELGVSIAPPAPAGSAPTPMAEWCALLAATQEQRAKGLMGVTDLRGYRGMVFSFAGDSQSAFTMRDTPMPLSIAWFRADGTFVSSADMTPCPPGSAECPVYAASGPYRYAVEVPQGHLADLGIGPGSRLVLGGACPAT